MVGVFANEPGDFPLKFCLKLFQMKISVAVFFYVQFISFHTITQTPFQKLLLMTEQRLQKILIQMDLSYNFMYCLYHINSS